MKSITLSTLIGTCFLMVVLISCKEEEVEPITFHENFEYFGSLEGISIPERFTSDFVEPYEISGVYYSYEFIMERLTYLRDTLIVIRPGYETRMIKDDHWNLPNSVSTVSYLIESDHHDNVYQFSSDADNEYFELFYKNGNNISSSAYAMQNKEKSEGEWGWKFFLGERISWSNNNAEVIFAHPGVFKLTISKVTGSGSYVEEFYGRIISIAEWDKSGSGTIVRYDLETGDFVEVIEF